MRSLRQLPETARAFGVAAAIVLLVTVLLPALPTRQLHVQVDLTAASGSQVAVYLNELSDPPQLRALVPNRRTVYEFEGPDGDIERIRVDVHDATGSRIRYHGIQVRDEDGELVAAFPAQDLAGWAGYSVSIPALEADAYSVSATAPVAALDAFRHVSAPSKLPWPVEPAIQALKEPQSILRLGLIALGLGAVLLCARTPRRRRTAVVGAACAAAVVLVLELVLRNPAGLASAASGVGRATYLGLSLPTNIRAVEAMYISAVVVAVVAAVLWRWRNHVGAVPATATHVRSRPTGATTGTALVAAVVALAAVASFMPDLRAVVREAMEVQYQTGWDTENLLVWSEFAARGLVPMKDFWYPYGNFAVFESGLLKGEIAFAAYQLILFAAYWWIFWIAAGRRLFASSVAALGLLAAEPIVGEFFRYGLALAIALAYTCIDFRDQPRLRLASRVVFGLLVVLALFLDPILVGYAALGVGLLLLVDVATAWRLGARWWVARLAADFAIPLVGLVAAVGVAAVRGQLDAFMDLYLTLEESAAYSALPTPLTAGLRSALDVSVLAVWLPPVLLGVGVFARLTTRHGYLGPGLSSQLIVIGAVAAPLVLKHAVRLAPTQLLLFPVVFVALALVWASGQRRSWASVGVLGGIAAAVVLAYPGPDRIWADVKGFPRHVAADVELLVIDREEAERARAARFADERFGGYPQELAVAHDLRNRPELRGDTAVYVLGDAPVLYVLLRQRPPWQINVYNTSLIEDQQRVIDWLREERPAFVVVDRVTPEFDGVPHDVRIPLVFQHVISNYAFDHAVGSFDVLVRRSHRPVDAEYWNGVTGGDSHLGRVLDVSSYDDLDACGSRGSCGTFLRLEAPSESWSGAVEIPIRFGKRTTWVRFNAAGRQRLYTLSLERLWGSALAGTARIGRRMTRGWRATIVRGEQPSDVLY